MKSDNWLIKDYKKGTGKVLLKDKIDYHIWFCNDNKPIGVTIDFEYDDDVHYELEYLDWLLFLQKTLNVTNPSKFDEALKKYFSDADCFSFEKELTNCKIEYSKIAFY